ncbi:hypothetical protein FACS189434_08730 [Bacteroidia bacterium]|nr:hypothetical protein FACS189434_08730 [Bacteroidia bacterium]
MENENTNETVENQGIPIGDTTEDKKQRKRFIMDFYKIWETLNPEKQIFNKSLKEFVNVKHISVKETAGQASTRYKSTLAILFLNEILANAIQKGQAQNSNPAKDNQKGFEKIIIMEYDKPEFGKIKLTVGVKRGTKEKVQYCITAIEND